MTDRKLSKVRVQDCQQYTDCNQCLGAKVNQLLVLLNNLVEKRELNTMVSIKFE